MKIAKSRRGSVAVVAVALVVAGCSTSQPTAGPHDGMPMASMSITAPAAPAGGDQVVIDGFAFAPATLTVKVGSSVTWTNRDEEPHTVAATDGAFHSPGMGTGATYSHTFAAAGTFDYVCSIHPMMHGTVVVVTP